jgi:hypothetical protein
MDDFPHAFYSIMVLGHLDSVWMRFCHEADVGD